MLGAVAIVWMTLDARATTPEAAVGRGWTIAAEGDASVCPLFVYPEYQSGVALRGGFRLTHELPRDMEVWVSGRAGGTLVDNWRSLFEAAAQLAWRRRVEVRAGARHDNRLRREGALADFRDPTGRVFVEATVLPIRIRHLALGASVSAERAMPGAGRLPSGAYAAFVVRLE